MEQIRRIGSDPRILERAIAKAEEQRRSRATDLTIERRLAEKELSGLATELRKLVPLIGHRNQTVTDRMADLQERIGQTERRLSEVLQELESLERQAVDESDFRVALAEFGPVWESLNSREQSRIVHSLVERVAYDGRTNRVTVSFRSAGIRGMCNGTGNGNGNES